MWCRTMAFSATLLSMTAMQVTAQTAPNRWAPIPDNAVFETGDTWMANGQRFRLYGVQACLRGTFFTNTAGVKRDCGEASLAMLVSLVRDLRPVCTTVAWNDTSAISLVTCIAILDRGAAKGSRIDLGTALISGGFGFAALKSDSQPVHQSYFVAQIVAQKGKSGLWAYPDLPEPNTLILRAMKR